MHDPRRDERDEKLKQKRTLTIIPFPLRQHVCDALKKRMQIPSCRVLLNMVWMIRHQGLQLVSIDGPQDVVLGSSTRITPERVDQYL